MKIKENVLHKFPCLINIMNIIETAKFILEPIFLFVAIGVLIVFSFSSIISLMLLLTVVFLNVKKSVKMAFSDPEDINYIQKTDKELFSFLFQSCIMAFVLAIASFQILIYITLLLWFYFIIFMLMFSKVWKFHGKKPIHLFSIIIATTFISFIAAPFVRDIIYKIFYSY